jgi:alpha-1,2-mannosyltransferase
MRRGSGRNVCPFRSFRSKGRIASSWRGEWLDLSPPLAGAMIKAGMIVLLAHIAWRFRRPAHERHDHTIVWEGAVVSLVILLYSPLTWRQHCVAVLPAFYLIARTKAAGGRLPKWMRYALGIYVILVLVFDRGVVGRDNTLILDSFGATTWSILLLLAVTLGCHARQAAAATRRASQPNFVRLQRQKRVATSYEHNLG